MSVSAKTKDEALRKYPLAKKGLLYLLDARMREYEDITGKRDIRILFLIAVETNPQESH